MVSGKKIRVLIVDDSAFMRRVITTMLESDESIQVVAFSRDGKDALVKIKYYKPDVVTMDVEMPGLNGLETLRRIMAEYPLPVVMFSALTTAGAKQTIEALQLGAVDFVAKPANRNALGTLAQELIQKVKTASEVKVFKQSSNISRKNSSLVPRSEIPSSVFRVPGESIYKSKVPIDLVAIGTSTGGPSALQVVLSGIPKDFPCGIVVVQHMPKGFTRPLANRLNELCSIEVKEGEEGDLVLPGRAIIAPAGMQISFKKNQNRLEISLGEVSPIKTLFKPSVDVMILSAVENLGARVLGVIMTGMGNDGLLGLRSLKEHGGIVLAQDENSCVVYGMPRAAHEAGIVDQVLPLQELSEEICSIVQGPLSLKSFKT
ncbi:MAG: chemotaxis response regulator protein-glutamate methylesterase [Bacillota bacterium]